MQIFGVLVPESIVIAVSGILGGFVTLLIKGYFDKPKVEADTATEYATAAAKAAEALTAAIAQNTQLIERQGVRQENYDKAFDRIREQFARADEADALRRKERLLEQTRADEALRQKNGEILVLTQTVRELERKAQQWQSERAGLLAMNQNIEAVASDVSKLKEDTGELKMKLGEKKEEQKLTEEQALENRLRFSKHTENLPPLAGNK